MTTTPMRRVLPLLLMVLLASAVSVASAVARADVPKLQVFASAHYHIYTNLTQAETVPFGRHMDAVYEAYGRRFAGFPARDNGPMPLYLFRSQHEYLDFLGGLGIHADHSGGMFFVTHRLRGLATFVDRDDPGTTYRVLQHEGFHQFAWRHLGPNVPMWLNEGIAQYFEDAPLVNGRLVTGVADLNRLSRLRHAARAGRTLPLEKLFGLTEQQWSKALHTDASQSSLLYAQSWSVVYFLIHGDNGKYRPAFINYLHRLSGGTPPDAAFRAAFGTTSTRPVELAWGAFVQHMEPPPLSAATAHMEFLATALRYYDDNGWDMPANLQTLQQQLRQVRFAVRKTDDGVETILDAADNTMYAFKRTGGDAAWFKLLEPSRNDLPPRITAPGLVPEPVVTWSRLADGSLRHQIEYR